MNLLLSHVEGVIKVINTNVDQADQSDELMEGVSVSYADLVGYFNEVCGLSASQENTTAGTDSSAEIAKNSLTVIQAN